MTQRLVIFTRYPEPHKTKTRLIPALGAEGAADLQRAMTRYVLDTVREFAKEFPVSVEVRFEGDDSEQMATCFGTDLSYRRQGQGDLGQRLKRTFEEAFSQGARRTVIIGADCPDITPRLLRESFELLADSDLVIGPAFDGGYYLIGLREPRPQLFDGISWGGEKVFDQTMAHAERLSLSVALLETLSDVDRPEDLPVWHRAKRRRLRRRVRRPSASRETRISVIIPTLNESEELPKCLGSVFQSPDVEVLVVDGDSTDGTRKIATREGCRVLCSPPGRAVQMNVGANAANGSILLFLHADTRLSPGFDSAVTTALDKSRVAAGAFRLRIDAPGWPLRLIERTVNIRSRIFQMPYGDQGIFLRKETFEELGGFPVLPLMEDFEFVRQLRRRGRIVIAALDVATSARRWQELGPWRTTWINQKIILARYLGVSPERLAAWYVQPPPSQRRTGK